MFDFRKSRCIYDSILVQGQGYAFHTGASHTKRFSRSAAIRPTANIVALDCTPMDLLHGIKRSLKRRTVVSYCFIVANTTSGASTVSSWRIRKLSFYIDNELHTSESNVISINLSGDTAGIGRRWFDPQVIGGIEFEGTSTTLNAEFDEFRIYDRALV